MSFLTRSVGYPEEMSEEVATVAADFGNVSKFFRAAVKAYLAAKGGGQSAAEEAIGVALLKAQAEESRIAEQSHKSRRERIEQRLEDLFAEEDERRASGAATERFATVEDAVAHYAPKMVSPRSNEGAWRNVAKRTGFKFKDLWAVAQRPAAQSSLQKGRGSQ